MVQLNKIISYSMKSGCGFDIIKTATKKELAETRKLNLPSKIDSFFSNAKKELINLGWKKYKHSTEIASAQYSNRGDSTIYRNGNRFAILSKSSRSETGHLEILSSIEYEVREATNRHNQLYLSRWDITPKKGITALSDCGWVITQPSSKIIRSFQNFEKPVFFKKGNMFAVTGFQNSKIVSSVGHYSITEPTIIIDYYK